MANDSDFATWLRSALNGRPNVFLVRNSGKKENGRPVIDDSRVSKWLKGDQRPSMELAILAARVLGRPPSEALIAAGHGYGHSLQTLERIDSEFVRDQPSSSVSPADHDEPKFLTRVREDLTTEEWETLVKEAEPFIELLKRDVIRRHRGEG